MKKFFLIALLITNFCFCQNNEDNSFETNYKLLLENLTKQNWGKSQDLAKKLLDLTESVDSMQIQKEVVRYMYIYSTACLLYTSDAADEGLGVDLGGRRIIGFALGRKIY